MRKVIFVVLALGIFGFYYFNKPPENPDWLYGEWELHEKYSESIIENFTFNPDGTMVFGNSKGVVYHDCTYSFFNKTTIDFECNINGQKAVFPLEVNLDHSVITTTDGNKFVKSTG